LRALAILVLLICVLATLAFVGYWGWSQASDEALKEWIARAVFGVFLCGAAGAATWAAGQLK
jgi:hypothetical protein